MKKNHLYFFLLIAFLPLKLLAQDEIKSDITADVSIINRNTYNSPNKNSLIITLAKFPARLNVIMSNGKVFQLSLYKSADWTVRIFMNK
jgi:hypothetical protein